MLDCQQIAQVVGHFTDTLQIRQVVTIQTVLENDLAESQIVPIALAVCDQGNALFDLVNVPAVAHV
jgi:hypothetical protein